MRKEIDADALIKELAENLKYESGKDLAEIANKILFQYVECIGNNKFAMSETFEETDEYEKLHNILKGNRSIILDYAKEHNLPVIKLNMATGEKTIEISHRKNKE